MDSKLTPEAAKLIEEECTPEKVKAIVSDSPLEAMLKNLAELRAKDDGRQKGRRCSECDENLEYSTAYATKAGCIQGACNRASIPCVLSPEAWGLTPEDCAIVREQEPRLLAPKPERLDDREQIYVYELMKARKVSPAREARYHGLQVWLYELLEAVRDSRGDLIPAGTKFYLTSCSYDVEHGVRCTIAAFFEGKSCT